ncbi:cistern family PEP-CTERM protein [Methylocaldum sp. MU1018]
MIKQLLKNRLSAAAVAACAMASGPAQAILVNGTSDDFSLTWNKAITGATLQATSSWDVTNFTSNQVVFDITLSNTTNPSNFQAAILALGVYVDQNLTGASITNNATGATWSLNSSGVNFPGGFLNVDICIYAGNQCQGGNINAGLQNQQTDLFTLTLSGDFTNGLSFADANNFAIKFQTQNGSYEFAATVPNPNPNPNPDPNPNPVPEPGMLWLLGGGLLGWRLVGKNRYAG